MKWTFFASNPSCSKQPLPELLRNQLNTKQSALVTEHLDKCETCQRRITELSADANWWREAGQWLENEPIDEDCESESLEEEFDENQVSSARDALIQSGLMQPSDNPELIGSIGRYDVRSVIGAGGTGVVLQAMDTELSRIVALKVLSPSLSQNGPARRRFSREGQAAAAVVHENVVSIHQVESNGPVPYLVMQYIEGSSLQELITRTGPLDATSTLRVMVQLASALDAAHAQGLVHRDVKPANILVGATGLRVWITDFGLARAVDDASLTRTGFIAGTPHYMSPEQARGETVNAASDLFGLGSVMYFALTGRPPFRAERSLAILNRICNERHRPVREVNPDVSIAVAAIVDRLLEKAASSRFQSAIEVKEHCVRLLSHPKATVSSPSLFRKKPTPVLQRIGKPVSLTMAVGLMIFFSLLLLQRSIYSALDSPQKSSKKERLRRVAEVFDQGKGLSVTKAETQFPTQTETLGLPLISIPGQLQPQWERTDAQRAIAEPSPWESPNAQKPAQPPPEAPKTESDLWRIAFRDMDVEISKLHSEWQEALTSSRSGSYPLENEDPFDACLNQSQILLRELDAPRTSTNPVLHYTVH